MNRTELRCFSSFPSSSWSSRVLGASSLIDSSERLFDLRSVLLTWSLELAYDSSWVPSRTPKKQTELNWSSDTT